MEKELETIDNAIEILNQTRSMFFADYTVYGGFKKSDFNKAINGLTIISAKIEETMKPKTCEWYKEDEEDWRGQCGCIWGFNGENPIKAEAYFCPQCGGKIIEIDIGDNA